jgi:chemotaxis protein histidine kinase CheA
LLTGQTTRVSIFHGWFALEATALSLNAARGQTDNILDAHQKQLRELARRSHSAGRASAGTVPTPVQAERIRLVTVASSATTTQQHAAATEAKRTADAAATEAKRTADAAATEAKRTADAAATEAKRTADAAAAETKRKAEAAAAETKRKAEAAAAETKRKAEAAAAAAETKRTADAAAAKAACERRRRGVEDKCDGNRVKIAALNTSMALLERQLGSVKQVRDAAEEGLRELDSGDELLRLDSTDASRKLLLCVVVQEAMIRHDNNIEAACAAVRTLLQEQYPLHFEFCSVVKEKARALSKRHDGGDFGGDAYECSHDCDRHEYSSPCTQCQRRWDAVRSAWDAEVLTAASAKANVCSAPCAPTWDEGLLADISSITSEHVAPLSPSPVWALLAASLTVTCKDLHHDFVGDLCGGGPSQWIDRLWAPLLHSLDDGRRLESQLRNADRDTMKIRAEVDRYDAELREWRCKCHP